MALPTRLADTTLGDLLATLHRAYASVTVEVVGSARRHRLHLRRGCVVAVECSEGRHRFGDVVARDGLCARVTVERAARDPGGRRIGQRLVALGALTHRQREATLEAQRASRLEDIEALDDADLRFEPPRALPPGSAELAPMSARAAYHGRARRRDRAVASSARHRWLRTLGLDASASPEAVRARYRERVRALHPDTGASPDPRALAEVLEAWRGLSGHSSSA